MRNPKTKNETLVLVDAQGKDQHGSSCLKTGGCQLCCVFDTKFWSLKEMTVMVALLRFEL